MDVEIATTKKSWREVYQLCIGAVNPRPIALVSTISTDGRPNLAPFSFFNMVSGNPPVLMVSTGLHRDGSPKHTLLNIRETREWAVAVVTESIAEAMVRAAAELPREQDEFAFSGLTPVPASHVRASLVQQSPVNFECRLREIVQISEQPGGAGVIFGDIVALHIADWVVNAKGRIDPHRLRTVGRLGGRGYSNVASPYELEIPSVGGD